MCLHSAAHRSAAKSMGADWSMKGGQATVLEVYVHLIEDRYCSMFPELLDPWTLQINSTTHCSTPPKAWHHHINFSYKFELLEKKWKVTWLQLFEFAVEGLCAKTRSNQLEDSVGRWQLASRNTVQPTDQRLHGMTASSLSVCPYSQAAKYHGTSPPTKSWLQQLII